MSRLRWNWYRWADLKPDTLYGFLKLRSDIFVVEQNCVFSDMDGADAHCEHLCGTDGAGQLLSYLRLVPPGLKSPQPALGRLVVDISMRNTGAGRATLLEGLRHCGERYPSQDIFLSAQQHLENFYASLGFVRSGAAYLEDGIWHVNMLRSESASK